MGSSKKAKAKTHKSQSENGNTRKNTKRKDPGTASSLLSSQSQKGLLVAATVVVLAYVLGGTRYYLAASNRLPSSASISPGTTSSRPILARSSVERLLLEWPSGGKVTVKNISNVERGLVAAQDISKGSVIASTKYHNLEGDMDRDYPELRPLIDDLLGRHKSEQGAKGSALTTTKILALLRFLQLVDIDQNPKWKSYADMLPRNVSTMAWHWTAEERKCVVSRPDDDHVYQDRRLYHAVMRELLNPETAAHPLLKKIYQTCDQQRIEWAYLMLITRGFGKLFFLPVLDMGNHDPLQAVPAFVQRSHNRAFLVAAQDIKKGDPIYNNYGPLSPISAAEFYGFVPSIDEDGSRVAYLEVPSIHRDIWRSDYTNTNTKCTGQPVKFFGNTGDQIVQAKLDTGGGGDTTITKQQQTTTDFQYSTHFKEYRPTSLAHACMRVMLQTENGTEMARYVAQQTAKDYNRYIQMANAEHCQSTAGNFPLIQKANQVMANLLWETMEVAETASQDESIPYPGIPEYGT